MAVLFEGARDDWRAHELGPGVYRLSGEGPSPCEPGCRPGPGAALLLSSRGRPPVWVLIAAPRSAVLCNGEPLAPLGISVLRDRDEVQIPSVSEPPARLYFSTEVPARIEAHQGEAIACPRCKQPIHPGTDAVQCPACGTWHHQIAELPCWTYAERCSLCVQPTDLNGQYLWTPAEL